jgi:hypothetical protein
MRTFYITVVLTLITFSVKSQSTSDTRDFSADYYQYTNGGGSFASNGGIGLYANFANKEVFISYRLCTDESNYSNCESSSRLMQVGDAISFQMKGYQVFGEVGVILNCSPSFSGSYSSKNSNQALEIRSAGHGDYWHIVHSGSNIETSFQSSASEQTWDVSIELTSKTTATVTMDDGTTSVNYYPTLTNSEITHITFYLRDDWSGSGNQNFYFGDDGAGMLISNDGNLTITDPNNNLAFGDISNPLQPGSTSNTHNLNLTIDDDITVEGDVDIAGNLIVNSSKSLTLGLNSSNEYSQLKTEGSITNNGSITHEQYISSTGHHGISSPMTTGFNTTSGTASSLYEYDASSTGVYVGSYVGNGSASTSTVGRGFFAPVGNSGDFLTAIGEFSVTGTPNTSHDWTLSYVTNSQSGASDNGWNLIGNPYSATLDWNSVLSGRGSNVNGAIYVWDPSNSQYMSWTTLGGVNGGSQYIPPMQAFWVQTTSGGSGTDYDVNTTMTSNTLTTQSPTFQKSQNDILKLSVLDLSNSDKSDEIIIANVLGSLDGFDESIDAWKLPNDGGNPNIYSFDTGDQLAINAVDLSTPKVIPMGIDAPQSGSLYQLSLEQVVNADLYDVLLEDKFLNTFTDITKTSYSFQYGVWPNNTPRFNLHLSATNTIGIGEDMKDNSYVYQHGNQVFINSEGDNYTSYELWAIDGRLIRKGEISSSVTKFTKPKTGLYFIKLLGNGNYYTIKTFLK